MKIIQQNRFTTAFYIAMLFFCGLTAGCKKFLDEKPDQKLATPSTVNDVQALLDNYSTMNTQNPSACAASDDDFYLLDTYVASLDYNSRNMYTWQKDVNTDEGWKAMYGTVLNSNLSLETLEKIEKTTYNASSYNNAYGSALFFRSFAFFQLLQNYAKPFDPSTSSTDPGIPLRIQSDVSTVVERDPVSNCYNRIIADAKKALSYLPDRNYPVSRPSRAAAFSLLSNVYISMADYSQAGLYADSALHIQNTLLTYSAFDTTAAKPFTKFNDEVIFSATIAGTLQTPTSVQKVDTALYLQYKVNDLRRPLFFKKITGNQYGFKGNYQGNTIGQLFNGFAVDELLLIRAECAARTNNLSGAINDLNTLLIKRFKAGLYIPVSAVTAADALNLVLTERRKELVGRARRWYDLRRLNKEPLFAKTLRRFVQGTLIELPPNDKRYTYYLPQQVINMSGLLQNER